MSISKIPEFLIDKLEKQYGTQITKEILEGYKINRPVTFRVNTLKSNIEEIEEVLKKENIIYEKVKWCNEAYILKDVKESDIQELEIYKDGKIYLQSLSSMLPPIILEPKESVDILDMCAAPRWKNSSNRCTNK